MTERSIEHGPAREKVVTKFDSIEAAIELVKEFWRAMPHQDLLTMPEEDDVDGWKGELTAGDRTMVVKGLLPADKGKWFVIVQGNHQPLTKEAESWLRGRGL